MPRNRTLRRAVLVALSVGLVLTAQASNADEWYPGLPDPDGSTSNSWMGAAQGGLSYAARAKQWFRSPMGMVTFTTYVADLPSSDPLVRAYEAGGKAFVVSPPGAPEPYGYMEPMTVRSVGFGLMPVEATVQVSQRRKDGYPIPLESAVPGEDHYHPSGGHPYKTVGKPTVVEDAFQVQILKVRVDGHDLQLNGACRTVTPAPVRLASAEYTIPDPRGSISAIEDWFRSHDPSEFFHPFYGGQLSGTMTIPAFTGCTTASGDDLSALMTLSVSGPDNAVTARVGWPCTREQEGTSWPLATGESNPRATVGGGWHPTVGDADGCSGSAPFDYPRRP